MKKILLLVILLSFIAAVIPKKVFARDCGFRIECKDPAEPDCKNNSTSNSTDLRSDTKSVDLIFDLSKVEEDFWSSVPSNFFSSYKFYTHIDNWTCKNYDKTNLNKNSIVKDTKGDQTDKLWEFCTPFSNGSHTFHLKYQDNNQPWQDLCTGTYSVSTIYDAEITIISTNGLYDVDSLWDVRIDKVQPSDLKSICTYFNNEWINNDVGGTYISDWGNLGHFACNSSSSSFPITFQLKKLLPGTYTIILKTGYSGGKIIASHTFTVVKEGDPIPIPPCPSPNQCTLKDYCDNPLPGNYDCGDNNKFTCCILPSVPPVPPPCLLPYQCRNTTSCMNSFPGYDCQTGFICCAPEPPPSCFKAPCGGTGGVGNPCIYDACQLCPECLPSFPPLPSEPQQPQEPVPSLAPLCEQIDSQFTEDCRDCIENPDLTKRGIWTAIGCLPTNFGEFVSNYILKYGIGIAGGIAFLYLLYGIFLIMTSAGNAEAIGQAKEIIVSAISGLILIIFSVFLLKVIGVDILMIPGFGG